MKSKETQLMDELMTEHERRVKSEYKCEILNKKITEMRAFQ